MKNETDKNPYLELLDCTNMESISGILDKIGIDKDLKIRVCFLEGVMGITHTYREGTIEDYEQEFEAVRYEFTTHVWKKLR